jgi:predicted permease
MLVLGGASAALATIAGLTGVRATVGLTNGWLLREAQLRLDPRTVAFTAGVTLAASLAVGLLVAFSATCVDLGRSLAEGGRATPIGRRQRMLRDALVSTEAAIAMVLLAGAGLLIASFARLSAVDPGFQREGIFTAKLTHAPHTYDSVAAIRAFERRVLEHLRATPGILSAGSTSTLPLTHGWNLPMTVEGRNDATEGGMEWRSASGDYFRTMGIRPVLGRPILDSDDAGAPPVVVISESFARKYWRGQSPIGHRLLLGRFRGKLIGPAFDEPAREIVGVVPDLRDMALDQKSFRSTAWVPRPQMVAPLASLPAFVVRATDASVAAAALRRAVLDVDSELGVPTIASMDDVVSASLWWRRFGVVLMSVFATVALVLTCVGIYGVVSYSVAQRVQEIGIRIALGARPSRVTRLVVAQGMRPAILGLIVGLAGALALTRLLRTMLYQVSPREPLPLGLVALLLVAIALVASYIPARRAARVDPLTALRGE